MQKTTNTELIAGIFWIILSVIGYSLLPLFGNLAYKSGVVLSTAVFIRFITATFFLEIHSLVQPLIKPNKNTNLILALALFLSTECKRKYCRKR